MGKRKKRKENKCDVIKFRRIIETYPDWRGGEFSMGDSTIGRRRGWVCLSVYLFAAISVDIGIPGVSEPATQWNSPNVRTNSAISTSIDELIALRESAGPLGLNGSICETSRTYEQA